MFERNVLGRRQTSKHILYSGCIGAGFFWGSFHSLLEGGGGGPGRSNKQKPRPRFKNGDIFHQRSDFSNIMYFCCKKKHFIEKKKSACGVRTGLKKKNLKTEKWVVPQRTHFIEGKKTCSVRTGLTNKNTYQKLICTAKNAFYPGKKKHLQRTHLPQKEKI